MGKTIGVLFAAASLAAANVVVAQEVKPLAGERERQSYAIGVEMGNNMKKAGADLDAGLVAQGIKDAISGAPMQLTEAEQKEAVMAFQKAMMAKQQEAAKARSEKAHAEGEAYLAANKQKQGVVTLPSGLQYRVITDGSGPIPKSTDTVSVNYRGTLVDGTEFDSSYKRGQPASFPVTGVIAGWTEALQLMKVGSKWELVIPANLAYGERGAGGMIPPGATLVFEVELLGIK